MRTKLKKIISIAIIVFTIIMPMVVYAGSMQAKFNGTFTLEAINKKSYVKLDGYDDVIGLTGIDCKKFLNAVGDLSKPIHIVVDDSNEVEKKGLYAYRYDFLTFRVKNREYLISGLTIDVEKIVDDIKIRVNISYDKGPISRIREEGGYYGILRRRGGRSIFGSIVANGSMYIIIACIVVTAIAVVVIIKNLKNDKSKVAKASTEKKKTKKRKKSKTNENKRR